MKKLIKVTQENINAGVRGASYSCPVALALKTLNSDVGLGKLGPGKYCFNHLLPSVGVSPAPDSVSRFAQDFDNGFPVKPFNFYFDMDILK